MSRFDIDKPWLYEDRWMIFPDTVFSNLEITDCNDTLSGVCTQADTLEDCIKTCSVAKGYCGAGYFIKRDGGNICVPIRTGIHPYMNPAFRLRKKSIYPVLKDTNVSTYIDTKIYEFPPNIPNAVFYEDNFFLQNVETGTRVKLPEEGNLETGRITFTKDKGLNIQLLPSRNIGYDQSYVPVLHSDPVLINIPGTTLIMRKRRNNEFVEWIARLNEISLADDEFKIYPTRMKKKESDFRILNYSENIYITYQDIYIVEFAPEYNTLRVVYMDYETAKGQNLNVTFTLKPNFTAYYCDKSDDNKCKAVPLEDTDVNDLKALYKGNRVYRNPSCWGGCDWIKPETSNTLVFSHSPSSKKVGTIPLLLIIIGIIIAGACLWMHGR